MHNMPPSTAHTCLKPKPLKAIARVGHHSRGTTQPATRTGCLVKASICASLRTLCSQEYHIPPPHTRHQGPDEFECITRPSNFRGRHQGAPSHASWGSKASLLHASIFANGPRIISPFPRELVGLTMKKLEPGAEAADDCLYAGRVSESAAAHQPPRAPEYAS